MAIQSRWMGQMDPDSTIREYSHRIDPPKITRKQSSDKILTLLDVVIRIAQEENRFHRFR